MTQYIEALEGIFPIPESVHSITRKAQCIIITYTDDTTTSFKFSSQRGRDGGYAELINGLGRNPVMNIARCQVWTDNR